MVQLLHFRHLFHVGGVTSIFDMDVSTTASRASRGLCRASALQLLGSLGDFVRLLPRAFQHDGHALKFRMIPESG